MDKEYILPIHSIIWKMKGLSHLEKFILIEIYALNLKNDCFAKNAHFADLFEVSTTQVSKSISNLIRNGYIEQSGFNGRERKLKTDLEKIKSSYEENIISGLKKTSKQKVKKEEIMQSRY